MEYPNKSGEGGNAEEPWCARSGGCFRVQSGSALSLTARAAALCADHDLGPGPEAS